MRAKHRATLGLLLGTMTGASLAICMTLQLRLSWGVSCLLIGIGSGVGGRMGRAFGTPSQIRLIVFLSLSVFALERYLHISSVMPSDHIGAAITANFYELLAAFGFYLSGLFIGFRLWLGGDVRKDLDGYIDTLGAD